MEGTVKLTLSSYDSLKDQLKKSSENNKDLIIQINKLERRLYLHQRLLKVMSGSLLIPQGDDLLNKFLEENNSIIISDSDAMYINNK